ncbi:lysophosphatidylserine lipase ABHD12 isoform X1 [Maniola jurtina]|uniref:lysophosphatidylserine lipase ABHD12 isoform X1 n=1 Tax=Maniola jurtina TaxID=191418 RepID=UPI001E68E9FA|nr:lysophosphatidylserine lipase ABHD12 isoform X1 [Maniola jurtina]XP_045780908.1 lysophosphatidylserine lipase ABHD12 isoform X1 [Maniola jurtina]XP_045780909.1 lysophosphatidylserine lipase ABHD12 isoform X1 [Maniola jurtina]
MKVFLLLVPLYIVAALVLGASITAGIFVVHVVIAPLLFKYSKTFRRNLIFLNIAKWPLNVDYDDPSASGIEGGRNFNIEYHSKVDNCKIKIGVWHILPKSLYEKHKGSFEPNVDKENLSATLDAELLNSKLPIMIYCHGNSNTRAAAHRVVLYKFFQKMDFHTIAFDYRGYADSTNVLPTEDGVVEDSLIVYDWLNTIISKADTKPPVFVWGHSLGTGISSHLLGNLQRLSRDILGRSDPLPLPKGLILEAPFNNLADEVKYHPLAKLVRWLPYFENSFVSPFLSAPEHEFKSDLHLTQIPDLPILILHSRDDVIVPHYVGKKLYEAIVQSRQAGHAPVTLHSYPKQEGLGHKDIAKAQDLPQVIGEFVKSHR